MAKVTAGAAKTVLTPERNLHLGGYSASDNLLLMRFRHRTATGVHDDIRARCLALSDGENLLALVALDLIGLFHPDVEEIRARAREKTGREDLMVVVASTHAHSGPDMYGAYGGVPRKYKELVHERASQAVAEAVQRMAPARIGFASTKVEGIIMNHRQPEGGPVDNEVGAMLVESEAGETIAVLVNAACHADVLGKRNTLISADFPAYVCRDLERERGGTALFFNGAQGDMYPRQTIEDRDDEKGLRSFEEAEAVGSAVARAALDALKNVKPAGDVSLEVRRAEIDLPVSNLILKVLRWTRVFKRKLHNGMARTEAWVINIDDAQIVTLPGQFFVKLGLELKAEMKGKYRFIFGLANDEITYVLPPEDWDSSRRGEEEMISLGVNTWPLLKEQLPPF